MSELKKKRTERLRDKTVSFFVGRQWWAEENPKKTPLYFGVWLFSAISTVSLAINGVFLGIHSEKFNNTMPSYLVVLWFAFFMVFLIFFTRSNAIQKKDTKNNANTTTCMVKKSYFPGWVLVILTWCIAWFAAQLSFFTVYHEACTFFGFNIPEDVVFSEKFWYQFLGVITSIFVINDIAREKLARQAESFFELFITNFFARIKSCLTGAIAGFLRAPEKKRRT